MFHPIFFFFTWLFSVAHKESTCKAGDLQAMQVRSLGREDPWSRKWQPTPVFLSGESHA